MWIFGGRARSPQGEDLDVLLSGVGSSDAGESTSEGAPEAESRRFRRPAAAAAVAFATAAVVALASSAASGPRSSSRGAVRGFSAPWAVQQLDDEAPKEADAPPACVGPGADCRASHCCIDGGDAGYQCFARDKDWAQCDADCTPGEHEGDKSNGWDQYGNPTKPKWTCDKLGERSKPGCGAYDTESKCPTDRCDWQGHECLDKCWFLPAEACKKLDRCSVVDGDKCKNACWTFQEKDECLDKDHRKRCEWKDDKCITACWMYGDKNSCLSSGGKCSWEGKCVDDPCSAPGEDCRKTKCCSAQRGGAGMTCFEKDQYYASCSKECGEDPKDEKGWSCKKLGNRTKTQTHCAWAGESCAAEGMCCNQGFICAVKDQYFTGCYQNFKKTSFKKIQLPPPPGWPADPKFVGGGQYEYEVQKAGPDQEKMGTSLYCFMAYLPGSYEERLMEIAKANYASVFACDEHDLFHTWQSGTATWDTQAATLTNIDVFIDVWQHVKEMGNLWKYDWTVKVDPDCLLVPQRLKWHLGALNAPVKQAIYVKNNNLNASIGNAGFLGAVEVFSREALELYFDWYPKCKSTMGNSGGEDGWMKGCMDALGVGYIVDGFMFKPDNDPRVCKDGKYAAYHPLKIQENYQCCIDVVNGGDHNIEWGQCKDLNPQWANKIWPNCADGKCMEPRWNGR